MTNGTRDSCSGGGSDGTPSSSGSDEELLARAKDGFERSDITTRTVSRSTQPQTIGQYRIISVLGVGGMGTVYEAQQQHPQRPVALKVVRGGRYVDEHYVRLFQRETQALARLRHPGIAPIYEAGSTDDGQHFFAMELVRGVPLNQYVRGRKLNIRDCLLLFRGICDAINYAHQRGVIHRDLKPSNILINAEGQPKVLDFGLARITDWDIAAATVVTEVGRIQGTLPYMSPEQARGNPDEIDLRSDVYSLGVILYELLTERLPYDVGRSVLHEAVRTICEDAPLKPSAIKRSLRGDLETIVLKALAKEPGHRYHSAEALAEDVERFLESQPILARPPGTLYQFRKLVARHKLPFAFLVALFVLIAGFGIWMRILYRAEQSQRRLADQNLARAVQAERRAANEAETARQVLDLLVDLFAVSDPDQASAGTILVPDILDRGAERIATELSNQPAIQGTLMDKMGMVYRNLGLYEPATQLLRKALSVRRTAFPEPHPAVAESLHNLGWMYKLTGDYTKAERLVSEALGMRRELLGEDHVQVADSLLVLASVRRYRADYASANTLVREALAIQRETLGRHHVEVAKSLETLAEILEDQGSYDEAEDMAREAVRMRRSLLGEDHPYVASAKQALATALRGKGRYEEAADLLREALAIYRESMGNEHQHVADVLSLLGAVLRDQGNHAAAAAHLHEAEAICRKRMQPDHPYVARCKTNLGWLLVDEGKHEEADPLLRDALAIYRVRIADDHPKLAEPMLGLAYIQLARGDMARAEKQFREALAICRKAFPDGHWSTAFAESALGGCLTVRGAYAEAEPLLVESHRVMRGLRGPDDRYVREALRRIISLYHSWGKPDKEAEYRAILSQTGPSVPGAETN